VADFNQFGSVKPRQGSDPQHCAQCEAMLSDALDGTLSAADQATFDLHMMGCPSCATMLADAQRGAVWMEMLKSPRPEPPMALLDRILAQTSGKAAAEAKPPIVLGSNDYLRTPNSIPGRPFVVPSATQPVFASNVLPFRTRLSHGFRSLGQTMLQPRLAMTAAMAFFSIALTLNLTGVRITELRASDLKPSSILRSCYEAKAKVVRYSDNLRVVYELESRVRDLQRSSDDDGSNRTTAPQTSPSSQPAQQPGNDQNPGKKPGRNSDQKQTKPNPGSSRRETPGGTIRLAQYVPAQAPPPSANQAFVVLNPSVFKQEGGLV
jgi:Putative zinc-finger